MIIALSNTFPVLYRSRFRGEYRTYLIEFAAVRFIFTGISFFFYLAEGFFCRTVKKIYTYSGVSIMQSTRP